MTGTRHRTYVNARGEVIANGSNRAAVCSWPHRNTCPLCLEMGQAPAVAIVQPEPMVVITPRGGDRP